MKSTKINPRKSIINFIRTLSLFNLKFFRKSDCFQFVGDNKGKLNILKIILQLINKFYD